VSFVVLCGVLAAPSRAAAQTPASVPPVLTFAGALDYAVEHYPTVRAALEEVNASAAGVDVARGAYLPRLDSIWQSNRATANNVFGQLLPQSVIPAMSGPVLPSASSQSVWGSAAGALFSWEPVDLGLRRAMVANAEAAVAHARAAEGLTRLDVQNAVGTAFLSVVVAERAAAAAQADFDRRDVLRRVVQTLVDNQLRAGAEGSRADAERAAAETRLIQARQIVAIAQTTLARVLGIAGSVAVDASGTLGDLPNVEIDKTPAVAHPLLQVHQAAIEQARAQETVLARTDLPRVYLQSAVFARGSGAKVSGALEDGADGLGLERANWAAGLQVVVPNLFDFATLRARKLAAAASTRAEAARYDEAMIAVSSQQEIASAMLRASRAVAANTPIQLAAARQSESQARARYQAGLAGLVDVADAQSLLAQAEIQDQLARVDVWRALFAEAVAADRVAEFLRFVRP
jgi:outer membrane protein TolC